MSNRDTSFTTFLLQRQNRLHAGFYKQRPTYAIPSQELMLQIKTGNLPIYTHCTGSSSTTPACNCNTVVDTPSVPRSSPSLLCNTGSLNTIAAYLRNYMTEFRNSNFWAYPCDGDAGGNYITDGGHDMFDTANFVTPWLLSGTLYNLTSTNISSYPERISYTTTSETIVDTNLNYVSLGWIYAPNNGLPQADQSFHPLTVIGYRCSGPVGWQIGGNAGADGSGNTITGYVYTGATVNGFQVHAGYRQIYNANDPTICNLIILLGHPSWNSVFGPVSIQPHVSNTDSSQFYMYSGVGSENILGIYILLSKDRNYATTPIPNIELETVISNITNRIKESMSL
uniref:Uncharacterized protein n=1 Tax=viral metagenome TaxID=1070528 RepID=A0A6C0DGB9_9ZZZZ